MDPQVIGADQWHEITRLLIFLYLFTGLGLTSAIGFLLAHAILPSLRESSELSGVVVAVRWLAYPLAAASLVCTVYALARALNLAADVMQRLYPRFWM
jgi:hypothetical protein